MIKRFPSNRNQRSKGVKVKHVLQVILLLGVCFWLIYQVKHNYDKKKELNKNGSKQSVGTETGQVLKLGRKDFPGKVEVNQNEKHEEEEEDEHVVDDVGNKREHGEQQEGEEGNKHETDDNVHEEGREEEEEENKHGAEEHEEDEDKSEEMEVEGGDVEIDENDHEKSDVDNDQDDDDVVDELKDKEEGDETENEDKDDEEKGGLVENHDNHEAREEHYKGDDASSAVAHDARATSTESETINLEHADLSLTMNTRKPENETTYHSEESNKIHSDSDLKVTTEGEVTDAISSNVTAGKETGNDGLANETPKISTDSHLDVSNNPAAVITEARSNLTGAGDDASSSSEQNKTLILSKSDHAQNATVNTAITGDIKQTEGLEQSGNNVSEGNLPDNDSTVSVKPENRDAVPETSSTLGDSVSEKTFGFVASNGTENIYSNLDKNVSSDTTESDKSKGSMETSEANETQNIDATEDEMFKGDNQTGETDEKSDSSSATEVLDSVEHDAIDSSDTQDIHYEMTKVLQTDLDTLPDIRNEGNDDDENTAE